MSEDNGGRDARSPEGCTPSQTDTQKVRRIIRTEIIEFVSDTETSLTDVENPNGESVQDADQAEITKLKNEIEELRGELGTANDPIAEEPANGPPGLGKEKRGFFGRVGSGVKHAWSSLSLGWKIVLALLAALATFASLHQNCTKIPACDENFGDVFNAVWATIASLWLRFVSIF